MSEATPMRPKKQESLPPDDDVVEVAEGILRLQLPIQFAGLGHVNCYLLPGDRGVTVIDPGLPGQEAHFTKRLAGAGFAIDDVHSVVVTHCHPDHFGLAGWLAEEAGADLVTHGLFRVLWLHDPVDPCSQGDPDLRIVDVDPDDVPPGNPFGGRTPWGTRWETMADPSEVWGRIVTPKPTKRVADGEELGIAGGRLVAVHTPGHTLDHLCVFDRQTNTLLAGDHILPEITPHVGALGTGRNPLAMYERSLHKVAGMRVDRVLPAHGQPFDDLGLRVHQLIDHHEGRLNKVVDIVAGLGRPDTIAVSHQLFRPQVWGGMAESETHSHLEFLADRGRLARHQTDLGPRYTLPDNTLPDNTLPDNTLPDNTLPNAG